MHLGIVMDGNRRWAQKLGLTDFGGHYAGAKKIEDLYRWCLAREIKFLTLYAFSTENWSRSPKEIAGIMKIGKWFLSRKIKKIHKNGVKLKVIGERDRLNSKIQDLIQKAEDLTKNNDKLTLTLAISYGGRAEIVEAVKKIIEEKIPADEINVWQIERYLYTAGFADPDLIIRTGGVQRLSNFMPWQSVYSELYFTKTLWPDFSEKDLDLALKHFAEAKRNFGK